MKSEQLLPKTHLAIRQLRAMMADMNREYRDRIRRLEKIQERLVNESVDPQPSLVNEQLTISPDDIALVLDPSKGL